MFIGLAVEQFTSHCRFCADIVVHDDNRHLHLHPTRRKNLHQHNIRVHLDHRKRTVVVLCNDTPVADGVDDAEQYHNCAL